MGSIREKLHQKSSLDQDDMEKSLTEISKILAFSPELIRLLQLTRANDQEKEKMAVLFAINNGKLKSRVLTDYMFARFSLANSKKGESRKELIEYVKASTPQIPKGFFSNLKSKFDF